MLAFKNKDYMQSDSQNEKSGLQVWVFVAVFECAKTTSICTYVP